MFFDLYYPSYHLYTLLKSKYNIPLQNRYNLLFYSPSEGLSHRKRFFHPSKSLRVTEEIQLWMEVTTETTAHYKTQACYNKLILSQSNIVKTLAVIDETLPSSQGM